MSDFICKKCGSTEYEIKDKPNGTGIAHGLYCAKCGFWHKWLGKEELKQYATKESKDEIIAKLQSENADLRERLDKAVELPAKVMIERTLVDGKFKPTRKAQAFNGRIGVVYKDETRWKGLLVDICSEKTGDYEAAEARLAELKGEKK